MNCVVCTLFEGNYHYGFAVLINSLYKNGFRGDFIAGFRGELPAWAKLAAEDEHINWSGNRVLYVNSKSKIIFVPVQNDYHLTNYKPDFMLTIFETLAINTDALFYFDPDIVVKCNWNFFETWAQHGVALVHEKVTHDMPPTHPIRKEWEKVILKAGKKVTHALNSYINGGFCGITKQHKEFLTDWREIFITGTKFFGLTINQWNHSYNRTYIFYAQDQDALNITAMCTDIPLSEMGPEAMDFIPGGWTMSHSTGFAKPWKKNFITSVIQAIPPTQTDKLYWNNAIGLLKPYPASYVKFKLFCLNIAAFAGRFYSRK